MAPFISKIRIKNLIPTLDNDNNNKNIIKTILPFHTGTGGIPKIDISLCHLFTVATKSLEDKGDYEDDDNGS